jgi:excisionase family DNA binding protein
VKDAAEALSIGTSTVWRMISEGRLKRVKIGGRTLIPASEIARLLEKTL